MDSTYACAVAMLRHIYENEIRLVKQQVENALELESEQKTETQVP
jgi:hypothetical protein